MNRKLFVFVTLLVVLGLLLTSCAPPVAEKKLRIAYIRPTNEPYYKYGFDGAEMMGKAMGVEVLGFISDMKVERELASVEDAITQKVDGIVLMSVSATAMTASINKAHEAGIPIFMIFGYNEDLMDKMVGTVQADCNLSGSIIGNWVAENIAEGEVAVIMGLPGRGDAECYRDAFEREMSKNPNLTLVASVPGDWNRQKAFDQMQNLITSNPDLKAVFVQNEDMSLGAIQALKESGMEGQVQIVSQNGAPYGLESIAADGIKATVGWSPSQEAALGMRMLVEHIRGTTVPKLTITPMKVLTKDNVGEATPWEPTEESTQATLKLNLDDLIHEFDSGAGY
ncbi:MAG: sugar ABC transporter substrate-binding protein [Chloroflexi bacterium]|nr:sugar ABC transporter substrate-binding protein [Chloroflexota bacterium]